MTIGASAVARAGLDAMVEEDWAKQEKRSGRVAGDSVSIEQAIKRVEKLIERRGAIQMDDQRRLEQLKSETAELENVDGSRRLAVYNRLRRLGREVALRNPLLAGKPILFTQRRRYICQMLHEYLGYYYGDFAGGGIFVLKEPGKSLEVVDLIRGRLPKGNYTTLSLSFDARTIYFAFCESAAEKPDYYAPKKGARFWQIYAMDADGGNLRQLTDDASDNFDPCELPDGGIAFMSTRRGGFGRCHNPWEPLPAYTLHRMDQDGKNARTLSFHETNEWHPSVLNDGRIAYIRWDYVDRSAANYHGIWTVNPDGTNPAILWGNYTERVNACYQPKAVPGSKKVMFVAGAHHADVGGSLLMVDPERARLTAAGQDGFDAVERLTPEVCFPEGEGWPKSFFHGPWPLSENYWLVGFSFEKLPGMSSGNNKDASTGIYLMDRWGNMELLYRAEGISSMYPIPMIARAKPPIIASALDRSLGDEGEYLLTDVRRSFLGLPSQRQVKELRIWQVLPKTTHVANEPRLGHANAESARMLLGTVPVETDGSAYFRAPAKKPLYFQAVDEKGRAVQTMRSVTYLQPGERRGCVGCHEPGNSVASAARTMAIQRGASRIEPGPDGTRPFSYVRLVQPIWDRHCVRCHDGSLGNAGIKLRLTNDDAPPGTFSRSYEALRPYLKWYEWGGDSIDQIVTRPGHGGATDSQLLGVLADKNHAGAVKLNEDEKRRICIWLDGNVPFYGVYWKEEQAAQRQGEAVQEPKVQ